jgi:hypothetical protein
MAVISSFPFLHAECRMRSLASPEDVHAFFRTELQ